MIMTVAKKREKARRNLIVALIVLAIVVVGGVGYSAYRSVGDQGGTVVKVGVYGNSDDAIWNAVQKELDGEKSGIAIELKPFQDGETINRALASGELDLNAFQHYAYLNQENKDNGYGLVSIGETYVSPLNLYSQRYKKVSEIRPGDKVAIPNDASNIGRALKVLDAAGLIRLKDSTKANPTIDDIASNPSGIDIKLNEGTAIVRLLPDYAAGVITTNVVINAGLKVSSAIYQSPVKSSNKAFKPYVNVIVARHDEKNNATYRKIVDAYHTKSVAAAINKNYKGAVVPVFKY